MFGISCFGCFAEILAPPPIKKATITPVGYLCPASEIHRLRRNDTLIRHSLVFILLKIHSKYDLALAADYSAAL